ncbi:MAG: hypothetical protein FJW77_03465 [Actinobacteria bacterium]|nr:hypothetical protein [Actinomycetota bacterium]
MPKGGTLGLAIRIMLVVAVVLTVLNLGSFLAPTNAGVGDGVRPNSSRVDAVQPSVSRAPAAAAGSSLNDAGEREVVRVGFLINFIQDIDLTRHRYQIDFYIWYQWNDPDFNPQESIEFMNDAERWATMRSSNTKGPVELEDGSFFYRERILSMFKTNMPLEDYPFDNLDLRIVLADKDLGADGVVFVLDDPAVRTVANLSVPGYRIGTPFATVTDWKYPPLGALDPGSSLSSRVTVDIPMQRPWLPSAVKTFIPLLVIVLCAAMIFLIRPEHIDARFGLGISALLTLVALKWITDGEMPLMDYLGFVDWLYLVVFLFIAAGLAETTYTTWQRGLGVDDAVLIRHDRRTFAIATTTLVGAWALVVIFSFFV